MILEIVDIQVKPGRQSEFEESLRHGAETILSRAQGYIGHQIHRGIESPERYLVVVCWNSIDDHVIRFRTSPLFAEWRALVGPFFVRPPLLEHFEIAGLSV